MLTDVSVSQQRREDGGEVAEQRQQKGNRKGDERLETEVKELTFGINTTPELKLDHYDGDYDADRAEGVRSL